MKKGDLLVFNFIRKSRWMSVIIALIFLLNTCAPAWARDGNHGNASSLKSLGSGVLVGAVTFLACYISPVAGAVGSAAGDLTGLYMYYNSYNDYGKTWIKIGKMEISKGQVCSMIAGIVASSAAGFIAGAIDGVAGQAGEAAVEKAGEVAVGSAAESAGQSAASAATQGLASSVVSSVIQLPLNIVKAFIQFVKDFLEKGLIKALENLLVALKDAFVEFFVTIAKGFWQTCKDIYSFITDPVGSIKKMWEGLIARKTSITANAYYGYGTEGAIDKALVNLGGDLTVGMIKLIASEYVKQNLEKGIYIKGKKIIGPVDETIAGMVGNMVSNYVGASMNVMVMRSLGDLCGWDVDNQAGFLSRGKVDGNETFQIKTIGGTEEKVSIKAMAGNEQLMNDVKNNSSLQGKKYDLRLSDGKIVSVKGEEILKSDPKVAGKLTDFNNGQAFSQQMTESGAKIVAMGNTNEKYSKNVSAKESAETLKAYGIAMDGTKLVARDVTRVTDGRLDVTMNDGITVDGKVVNATVVTIDLNKSTVDSQGNISLAIVHRQLQVSAQDLSNSGVTGNEQGRVNVRLSDKSVVGVYINSGNTEAIKTAVNKYNTALNGYTQTFGQYGVLVMADPNRSIGITVEQDGKTRNLTIGELSSQREIVAAATKNQVSKGGYDITLKDGSRVHISAYSLNAQVLGEIRNYHVMLNSNYYSQLFNMTGGLMYNIKGEDMNTKGILRSGYEAVRNMGFAPLVSTATRIGLLAIMDYHTHYGNDKGRIYENLWKMTLANAGANLVTDTFNNWDGAQQWLYRLEPGQNPFQTRGAKSFGLHMAVKALEESGGALSQIGWGYYCKKNDLNAEAFNEIAHLAGTSLVAGSIDALFRQDRGLAKTTKDGKTVYEEVTQTDPMLNLRLSWDNIGDSSVRFTKGVVGDFKNQFIEAALDTALMPFPLRSPGTGPNAFMNQWTVQDKFIQQVSAISQGASPIDADLMRLSSNLSYRADTNFAESFSAAISNRFLSPDFHSYAAFGNNGITDYHVNRSLVQGVDLGKNLDLKAAFENLVADMKTQAAQHRENAIQERKNKNFPAAIAEEQSALRDEQTALQGEQLINEGISSSLRSDYRSSRAGVAQDQFAYGNVPFGKLSIPQEDMIRALKDPAFTLNTAKEHIPFLYKTIKPDEEKNEDYVFILNGILFNISDILDNTRFNTLKGQLAEGVVRYSPKTTLLEYATVDQFGRLQNTYYYDAVYNGKDWQTVKQDKYTQHFYGPFGHQLSVTKDSTQIRPVGEPEKIAIMSKAWTEEVVKYVSGGVDTGIKLENFKYMGTEHYREEGQKILDALELPETEQREALSKLGIIAMGADEIKSKIADFLKQNPERVKEMKKLFKESWHHLGYNTSASVTAHGLQTSEWNTVIMMMVMEGATADGKRWDDLTPDEQMHTYINSTNFSRYLTDVAYRNDGAIPQGSAKRSSQDGQLESTNVHRPEQGANDQYQELPKTIYLPGYFSQKPDEKKIELIEHKSEKIGEKEIAPRQVSPNYSYDLSLYPTGSGYSPYSGPAYQVNAYEVNSNSQMEAKQIKQSQGIHVAEYHKFVGRSTSGISAFSDQTALPKWEVGVEYGMDGVSNSSQVKNYYYNANKISEEIGATADLNNKKNNPQGVKLLESTELHGIKDILGKEMTFVTNEMDKGEDPNYYYAFYKQYIEGKNSNTQETPSKDALLHFDTGTSIGMDKPLFLKSDFQTDAVHSVPVVSTEGYKNKVNPPAVNEPPIIEDELFYLKNMAMDDALRTFSYDRKETPSHGQEESETRSLFQKIKSLSSLGGNLGAVAAVKLLVLVDEARTKDLIADIGDAVSDSEKSLKLADILASSGESRDKINVMNGLGSAATRWSFTKEQNVRAVDLLSGAAKFIFTSGNKEEQEAWVSNIVKIGEVGDFKTEAMDLLQSNMPAILKTPGVSKILALNCILRNGANREERAQAQDSIIKESQGIFDTGTPDEIKVLYNSLLESQSKWSGQFTNAGVATAIHGLLSSNSETILKNVPSAQADFAEVLNTSEVYTEAKNLGINKLERFSYDDWNQNGIKINTKLLGSLTDERLKGAQKDGRPLAVVIAANADETSAFSKDGKLGQEIAVLQDAGYRVMYYEVENKSEITQCLSDACGKNGKINPADMMMYVMHGEQYAMQLGYSPGQEVNINDERYLKDQNIGSYLKSGGNIVLNSCSTGKGEETSRNMVNMFRKLFPQAKVRGIYGPVRPSTDVEFIIEKNSNKPVLKEVKFDVPVYMGDNIFQQFNKNLNKLNIVPTWTTTAIPLTSTNNNKNYS